MIEVDDKVIYNIGGIIKTGKVCKIFTNKNNDIKYYYIYGEKKICRSQEILKYEDIKFEEVEKLYKETKSRNSFLFLISNNEGMKLKKISLGGERVNILIKVLEKIPQISDYNYFGDKKTHIYILRKGYVGNSEFVPLVINISKNKFNISFRDFVKFNNDKEEEYNDFEDFNKISKELNKDIKYLIGNIYSGYRDKNLELFKKKYDLEKYVKVKKDLESNGDELLF